MSILIELRLCCYPTNSRSNKNEERNIQFVNGLQKFFSYLPILNKHNTTICVTDNTLADDMSLPKIILDVIPQNVKIITCLNNNFGSINKGAGDIEQWAYNEDFIKQFDWFIHFEPRQILLSFQFIESFLNNPRNLFTINSNIKHFNTGMFCIKSKLLLEYIHSVDLQQMTSQFISIEDNIYNFFITNNIEYDALEKMDVIYFPTNLPPEIW